jgi:nucleotide-binding universal stress UspA family protein
MEYENVLIPCDFSEYSEAAVLRAAEIHGVKKITLLHVGPPHELSLNWWECHRIG